MEINITTADGKTHEVTVFKSDRGDWRAIGYFQGEEIAVAGEPSRQQAIERWKSAYQYMYD